MTYAIAKENGISDFFFCKKLSEYEHPPCIHSHMEIVFVLKNSFDVTVSGKKYIVGEGSMVFIMPYEVHGYFIKDAEVFVIACPPEYFPEYREVFGGKEFEYPVTTFSRMHNEIICDITEDEFQDDFRKKALIYYAISEFIKNCQFKDKNVFEYDVYRKAIIYISEHYMEDINMEGVANYVGVSTSHLSRVLNSNGKPGFAEILNSLRIYAAKKMIERENVSVSEAAYAVGYGSIRNFNRVFRQYFACNPSNLKR